MSEPRGHVVAVGASWGGLDALRRLLERLPAELDAAVVVAQHRSAESHPTAFLDLLRGVTPLHVCEAEDKDAIEPRKVYVAAPDYHLLVDDGRLALTTDERVQFARPSIDVLLETAAESYRDRCIGVILTGANADGAMGLARVRELGGEAIVQDPATATRREMPEAALAAVPDAWVGAPSEIGDRIAELCGAKAAA